MWRPYLLTYYNYKSLIYLIAQHRFDGDLLHAELSVFNASLRIIDDFMSAYEAYRQEGSARRRNGGRFLVRFSDLDEIKDFKGTTL